MRYVATLALGTAAATGLAIAGIALAPAAGAATAAPLTEFAYSSAAGDYIGGGQSATFTPSASTTVSITGTNQHVSVSVQDSGTFWSAQLSPGRGDTLHPGDYLHAERDSFRTGRAPGLDVYGDGRGCNTVSGSFRVNQIAFNSSGALVYADIDFTQHCESAHPALNGKIYLNQFPLSYRQKSDAGDYVGAGATKTYYNDTSTLSVSGTAAGFQFAISGLGDTWNGIITAPTGSTLVIGQHYKTLRFADATHAGLDVFGDGRGCNTSTGTLTINDIVLSAGAVSRVSATFVQHCEGATPALHGTLHYYD